MAHVAADSPVGKALQERILPKMVELGWSTGMQDDTLSEYIVLMIANGGDEAQVAQELSSDLLGSDPDDPAPAQFAKWLFEQLAELQQAHGGTSGSSAPSDSTLTGDGPSDTPAVADAEMGEDGAPSIPTGPKSMRNGSSKTPRDKRMLGNINKSLDRSSDSVLHRVRGGGGTGRVNSHSREPPKGPRQSNIARNLASGAGRGMMQNAMPMAGNMNQMPYPQPQNNGQVVMDPSQMQQMLQMFERQAQMMAQLTSMPGFQNPAQGNGRPLHDRVEKRGRFNKNREQHNKPTGDTEMAEDGQPKEGESATSEREPREQLDAATTACRFDRACNNPNCRFGHHGPVTFNGTPLDLSAECEFGAACKNTRCALRHPSPAKKFEHQASTPCKYGAYCTNTGCLFIHPTTAPCKNGADCKEEGCKFWHNPVECKFPQCTNKKCPYKHQEGQKRGYFKSNQLVLTGEHVSERKFTTEGEEELIVPGQETAAAEMDVVS